MERPRAALNRRPRWLAPGLAAIPTLTLAVLFGWPLCTLLARVDSVARIGDALTAPGIGEVLWFTVQQAAVSTALTLVVGAVPAYVLARHRFRGRGALLALVTVPFMLPTVVVGAAFLAVLPDSWHGTERALVLAHVFLNIAVVVRLVGAMWSVLPTDLTAAARTLGASERQVLRHVVLPLLRPGLLAASTVVFMFTFTAFGTVRILGGPGTTTLEAEVVRRATQVGDIDGAVVLSVLQLLVLALVTWQSNRLQRRSAWHFTGSTVHQPTRARVPRVRLAAVTTALVMLVPIVALVSRSLRLGGHWSLDAWRHLGHAEIRPGISVGVDPLASLAVSLRFAAVAAAVAVAVGTLAALTITTARRAGRLLDLGMMLPLGTSAVTIGLGMIITFDTAPFDWRGEWWMIPLGHALVALPFVVRSLLPVLRSIPDDQRAAAATLGASPLRTWWRIDVRRIVAPAVRCTGIAAAISLGEFGATTFLTRTGRETLPIAIAKLLTRAGEVPRAQGFALSTMLLAVTVTILVVSDARRA